MSVFTYIPDKGFSKQATPRVLVTQFGDGYAHRMADGINNMNITWDMTFNVRDLTESAAIISFFEAAAGTNSFDWTPPDEATTYKVICTDWRQMYDAPIARSTSAKFVRVFQ